MPNICISDYIGTSGQCLIFEYGDKRTSASLHFLNLCVVIKKSDILIDNILDPLLPAADLFWFVTGDSE